MTTGSRGGSGHIFSVQYDEVISSGYSQFSEVWRSYNQSGLYVLLGNVAVSRRSERKKWM